MMPENQSFFGSPQLGKYTMSVAVTLTGVPAHRIRRFESFGLFKPVRLGTSKRLYSDTNINLIRQIAALESRGVNMAGVKTILEMQNSRVI